jgi:hypothetical protein
MPAEILNTCPWMFLAQAQGLPICLCGFDGGGGEKALPDVKRLQLRQGVSFDR